MMHKVIVFCGMIIFLTTSLCLAEELTITTYYPSPFGVYGELRSQKMAIGDTYFKGSEYCWDGSCPTPIDSDADLVVEGNVGIGTMEPSEKLDVDGKVKGTELCIGDDCRGTWKLTYNDLPKGALSGYCEATLAGKVTAPSKKCGNWCCTCESAEWIAIKIKEQTQGAGGWEIWSCSKNF